MEEGRLEYFVYIPPAPAEPDSPQSEMEKPGRVTSAGPWASSPAQAVSPAASSLGGGAGWAFISNTCGGHRAP